MTATKLILVAGLIDPLVCFELCSIHALFFFISKSFIQTKFEAPYALTFLSAIGVTVLFFLLNIIGLHWMGWRVIQDPVMMWYVR